MRSYLRRLWCRWFGHVVKDVTVPGHVYHAFCKRCKRHVMPPRLTFTIESTAVGYDYFKAEHDVEERHWWPIRRGKL